MRVPGPGGGNEEPRLLILKNFHKFGKADLFLQKQDKVHLVRAAVSAKQILFLDAKPLRDRGGFAFEEGIFSCSP